LVRRSRRWSGDEEALRRGGSLLTVDVDRGAATITCSTGWPQSRPIRRSR
jgi:hypothetical protein